MPSCIAIDVTAIDYPANRPIDYRDHSHRDVAIKILPEEFSQDKQRLDRFQREARLLAQLNHANIATLYALEEHDGQLFLVMELVEGETLAERIARGRILVDEAIPLFIEIAEGLEAAHNKGIVHRDLKPANIKIGPDGRPKILDFGLAKAFLREEEPAVDSSQSPTLTKGTALGAIMGTASYMSPEQARAKTVDKRADIWAFGCCLYEALTTRKAFAGKTVTDILAAVVQLEPDYDKLASDVGPTCHQLLRRCLVKDPKWRLHDVADARILLSERDAPEARHAAKARPAVSWIALTAIAAALAGSGLTYFARTKDLESTARTKRFVAQLSADSPIAPSTGVPLLALSPDGTTLAYVTAVGGVQQLFVWSLYDGNGTLVPGTEGAQGPFFSPDGTWIGYFADQRMHSVFPGRSAPTELYESGEYGGAFWINDTTILVGDNIGRRGIVAVSAEGREAKRLAVPNRSRGEQGLMSPSPLRNSEFALLTVTGRERQRLAILDLGAGEVETILEDASQGRLLPSGHLLFARQGSLFAVEFEEVSRRAHGVPVPVIHGVRQDGLFHQFAVSDDGTLVYLMEDASLSKFQLVWVDANGTEMPVVEEMRMYRDLRLAPGSNRLAAQVADNAELTADILIIDPSRGTSSKLTLDGIPRRPVWSPDGTRIAVTSELPNNRSILWALADGSGTVEVLLESAAAINVTSFTRDGRTIVFHEDSETSYDLRQLRLGEQSSEPLVTDSGNQGGARFSPDGRWIAYYSDETGRFEVFVQAYPPNGGKWQLTSGGGRDPVWSHNGDAIYFRSHDGNRVYAIDVEIADSFSFGQPTLLFEGNYRGGTGSMFDVSHDGRFVLVKEPQAARTTTLQVVVNWFNELERLVPTK